MKADRASSLLARDLHGKPARRRDLSIWLGTLASWRGGMVKRLVAEHGSVAEVLDREAGELRALLTRRRRRAPTRAAGAGRPRDAAGAVDEPGEDESFFASVLALTPEACAARRPPRPGSAVVAWGDPLYPPALRQLADPPLCLFVRADCRPEELVHRLDTLCCLPAVAVVGTRGPSPYGAEMAALLGRDLTVQGVIVVSGMAMGVDAAAQRAALEAAGSRTPATVGVLGCGADLVHPRSNAALFAATARRGLVVSEFAWGVPARAWRFPARNRVMAALTRGVVVVEGAERSGARITATHAGDLGREVLAVPGEAGKRLTAAPHALLRDGATLCESAADVVRGIARVRLPEGCERPRLTRPAEVTRLLRSSDMGAAVIRDVLGTLERGPMTAEQVAAVCGGAAHHAVAVLSQLEVDGLVQLVEGGLYRLRRA